MVASSLAKYAIPSSPSRHQQFGVRQEDAPAQLLHTEQCRTSVGFMCHHPCIHSAPCHCPPTTQYLIFLGGLISGPPSVFLWSLIPKDLQDEAVFLQNIPFKMLDNPGDQRITLQREFGGERIEVDFFKEDEEAEDDDTTDDGQETSNKLCSYLLVTIGKGVGPILQFSCVVHADEIIINDLLLKPPSNPDNQSPYEGPKFLDLDQNLQKEFYKYLEMRGITSSLVSFLQDCITEKAAGQYLSWLESINGFVQY